VSQVETVGRDEVYFVRREAAFALGALAKVVPEEIIHGSLASSAQCLLLLTVLTFHLLSSCTFPDSASAFLSTSE
jgi:hypothetical protein